jgi:deoxyribose-phosphate aldolase
MTQHELDEIVRLVGDELLVKLGHESANGAGADTGSCGCGHPANGAGAPSSLTGVLPETGVACPDWSVPKEGIASLIDHTLLRPDACEGEIAELCAGARKYGFATVCIHPAWVARAVRELQGSAIKTCTVIGFPHGSTLTPVKCAEAEQALKLGAEELDMVVNVGALKSGNEDLVFTEIRCLGEVAHQAGAILKVILEMGSLSEQQKISACVLARLAGADFVKTSTGFGPGGAEAADVSLMHRVVGGEMGIKAAGGVSSYERLELMMRSGATRIGASAGIRIIQQAAAGIPAAAQIPNGSAS